MSTEVSLQGFGIPGFDDDCTLAELAQHLAHPTRIAWENEEFILTPTITPLCRGHLLLIPKRYHPNIGEAMGGGAAFVEAFAVATRFVNENYGNTIFFEHGVRRGDTGCGISHAHLHIAPIGKNSSDAMFSLIRKDHNAANWSTVIAALNAGAQQAPYLFWGELAGQNVLVTTVVCESQFLRRMIAKQNDLPGWNWREFGGWEDFNLTITDFSAWKNSACFC